MNNPEHFGTDQKASKSPVERFFAARPPLQSLFDKSGLGLEKADLRVYLSAMESFISVSSKCRCFEDMDSLTDLLKYFQSVKEDPAYNDFRLLSRARDADNIHTGRLKMLPLRNWYVVTPLPAAAPIGSCLQTMTLLSCLSLDQVDSGLKNITKNKVNTENPWLHLNQAARTFKLAFGPGTDEVRGPTLKYLNELVEGSESYLEVLQQISYIKESKSNQKGLKPAFKSACLVLLAHLSPKALQTSRHVLDFNSFDDEENGVLVETTEAWPEKQKDPLKRLFKSAESTEKEVVSEDDFDLEEDEDGTKIPLADVKIDTSLKLDEQIHKIKYIEDRALAQLLQMHQMSEVSPRIWNEIERVWLSEYLWGLLEQKREGALPGLFICLSICLALDHKKLAKVEFGNEGTILSSRKFIRIIPVTKGVKPIVPERYHPHNDIVEITFPLIAQKLLDKCIFTRSEINKKTLTEMGYSDELILSSMKEGMAALRKQYGQRFNTRKIAGQLKYFSVVKTRDVDLAQLMFRRDDESISTGGHYYYYQADLLTNKYYDLAELYFSRDSVQ